MNDVNNVVRNALHFGLFFLGGLYSVFISLFLVSPRYDKLGEVFVNFWLCFLFTLRNGTVFWGIGLAAVVGGLFAWGYAFAQKKWRTGAPENFKKIKLLIITILWLGGMLSFQPLSQSAREHNLGMLPPLVIDANNDGRPDKWVYQDVNKRLVEIDYDRNGDGKADIFEYYGKNGKLIRKTVLKIRY
ncbi:MAG: hypothetical protein WBE75_07455 [Candidatus Omnitrophota bacterium]